MLNGYDELYFRAKIFPERKHKQHVMIKAYMMKATPAEYMDRVIP
jgi:hypothetical protein